ncbi:MAG: hypothetical protein OXI33_01185 [Chloroflexota bacterium]|nr:hypothetical protein [Chloroflexota bacterium]
MPELIEYWTLPIGEYRSYGAVPEYTISMNWTQSPSLGIQVAWQEGSPDGSWNLLAPDKITIRDLKPSTTYSVKAQICDHEGKYVKKGQCGPWSKTYSVVSRDEQPLAPTCVLSEGETGHQDNKYDYLGGGDWSPIVRNNYLPRVELTNPKGWWDYGIGIRFSGTLRIAMTVDVDGTWNIRHGRSVRFEELLESEGVLGSLELRTATGQTNDLAFSIYPEVVRGDRGRNAYTGVYKAIIIANGVRTEEITLPKELSDALWNTGTGVNYWVDAISSVRGTKYTQLGTGRSCDGS